MNASLWSGSDSSLGYEQNNVHKEILLNNVVLKIQVC